MIKKNLSISVLKKTVSKGGAFGAPPRRRQNKIFEF